MKKLSIFTLALILGLVITASAAPRECSISERIVLENTTDTPVTHTFTRGSHSGFVIVLPGQTVTVDVVRCAGGTHNDCNTKR